MRITYIWPVAFLAAVGLIVFLYLLKQRAKDQTVSSTMLWQEIYKNIEAKHPFEKFKHNILMYLQILLVLLMVFAMMAPVLTSGGTSGRQIFLVVDNSASMAYLYDEEHTRLDVAKEQAEELIDACSQNDRITFISCAVEAEVLYQGTDTETVKKKLAELDMTEEAGTLDDATELIRSLVSEEEQAEIICYTDTAFDEDAVTDGLTEAALSVYSMYSEGENCAVTNVNYTVDQAEEGAVVKTLAAVTNYGSEDVTKEVSLYADGELYDVQEAEIPAGGETVVYFTDLTIPADETPVLSAEISGKDSLTADNTARVQVTDTTEQKILLVTEGNVFLEKALSLDDSYEVYKTSDVEAALQSEDVYDLYVFDGAPLSDEEYESLSKLTETAGLMFWGGETLPDALALANGETASDVWLTFSESETLSYLAEYSFGVQTVMTYENSDWAVPFLQTSDGKTAGCYGELGNRRIAVVGFDIHDTDLALQTEFPIFLSQMEDYLLGQIDTLETIVNFPTEESDVSEAASVNAETAGSSYLSGEKQIRNLLLAVALLLLVIEWICYIAQVRTGKKWQYLAIRSVVMVLIVCAMAGLSVTKQGKKSQTVFLIDASDSVGTAADTALSYVKEQAASLPKDNEYAVVLFGGDASCAQYMTDAQTLSELSVEVTTTATNIEQAVQFAAGLYDEDAYKQMVLFSDGCENEGNMNLAAKTLKGNSVELYGVNLASAFGQTVEVYIDDLETPSVIHEGDVYNVTVTVTSNVETDALLTLYQGRTVKGQQEIHVTKGENKFVFSDTGASGTIASYKAVIEPEQDTEYVNNSYVTYAEIDAKPRILLVEGTSGEAAEFEKVLQTANVDYDVVTPAGVPTTVSELNVYKAVITLDVYYDDLRAGFANALQSFVKDYAGGYICIGGENSYALGGYRNTTLEDILPVDMDLQGEKQVPKLAMTMVIDRSGSMCAQASDNSQVTGLTLAKQAAIAGVNELRETDDVGVLAFDHKYSWVVDVGTASDLSAIKDQIETIGYGGGTSIYPALEAAYEETKKSDASLKHIILLTDGQDEYNSYDGLLDKINEAGITVSTVAVGSGADTKTLQMIAEVCGGRYYYTDVNTSIPRIFAQEVYLSVDSYLVNGTFYPQITGGSEIVSGLFEQGTPAFLGYVATTAKQTAEVVLESETGDPLLATWQYGLGRTVAWCSDGTNEWTAAFAAWEDYPQLWANIVNYVITDTSMGEDSLEVTGNSSGAKITYTTNAYDADTQVSAVVTTDDGTDREITLHATKPGTFEAECELEDVGVYSINVRKNEDGEVTASYNTAYAVQYSKEYQFTAQTDALSAFCTQAEGSMIEMTESIWSFAQNRVRIRRSLTMFFLTLAFGMLLFDIVVRRLALDPAGGIRRACEKTIVALRRNRREQAGKKSGRKELPAKEAEVRSQIVSEEEQEKEMPKKTNGRITDKSKARKKKYTTSEAEEGTLDMATLLKKKQEREK